MGYLSATTHVVIVFGKHLIRDQVTVEFAKRIVTLVKQIASGALDPTVICFTGGNGAREDGCISEAVAGYAFFRTVCEEANIDVDRFEIILEQRSRNTKENLRNVIEELRRRQGSDAVSACHFTLVSSDYHLIRIQEVHRLSPRQSVLFPLEVSASTWNCIFAAYPFCVSREPATAFLGRAVVLANDLGIVLVNLNGVIDDREFLSKENLHRLNETFAKMRDMYRIIDSRTSAAGGFRTNMRKHAEALELAIQNIRQVHTLLNPLAEMGASVSRPNLELARELLISTISSMRSSMDPDRVLRVHDRLAIVEDMADYVASLKSTPQGPPTFSSNPPALSNGSNFVANENAFGHSPEFGSPRPIDSRKGSGRISSEVTWQGNTFFKGNGKKITRDGPNIVITDNNLTPRSSPSSTPPKRSRSRCGANTQADSLAGSLAGLTTKKSTLQTTPRTRSAPAPGTRTRSTTQRKARQTSSSGKKRKSSARKLASPSSGETA